jgi:tRNA threonylcarbamoyladenosine dehydratase
MPERSFDSPIEIPPQLTRTVDMLGEEGVRRLLSARVVVVGLGAVGSHAAVALARSGVGRVRLVDFDVVTSSSLNRHALATLDDLGLPKTAVVATALSRILATIDVDQRLVFVDEQTTPGVLEGDPDYVIDAIDSLGPKTTLLECCVRRGLPVVSSMGAASREDPTKLAIATLAETAVCPLAKHLRKRLRRRQIALEKITTVYSYEQPVAPLPPDDEDPRLERGRARNRLPSLATLPGIFGYALAGVVIRALASAQPRQSGEAQ